MSDVGHFPLLRRIVYSHPVFMYEKMTTYSGDVIESLTNASVKKVYVVQHRLLNNFALHKS